jgi:hypothetical protein
MSQLLAQKLVTIFHIFRPSSPAPPFCSTWHTFDTLLTHFPLPCALKPCPPPTTTSLRPSPALPCLPAKSGKPESRNPAVPPFPAPPDPPSFRPKMSFNSCCFTVDCFCFCIFLHEHFFPPPTPSCAFSSPSRGGARSPQPGARLQLGLSGGAVFRGSGIPGFRPKKAHQML